MYNENNKRQLSFLLIDSQKVICFVVQGGRILIKPLIEFCVGNLASGSQAALEKLEKDPNLDVMEYGCLGYCGICFEGPFALVNGEVVQGATVEELVNNVYDYLDENPMF